MSTDKPKVMTKTCPKCCGSGRDGNLNNPGFCWVCHGSGTVKATTMDTTELPTTMQELQALVKRCEQRINELQWQRLAKEPCKCDRYTCFTCRQMIALRPFVCEAMIADAGWTRK